MYNELIERLRKTPTQPYCVAIYDECDYCNDARDAADVIERLTAQLPAWISVEERLPKEGTRCLVARFDDVTRATFTDILWYDGIWWNRMYKDCGDFNVTHWMPLPKHPEVKQ